MNNYDVLTGLELPQVIALNDLAPNAFIEYYNQKKSAIENDLEKFGAVKFTGVIVDSIDAFQHIVESISTKFLNYVDGNSPRTKLSGNVYTSTEYDNTQRITMHNELSYSAKWPNKLFFSCLIPSETGGETLLADSRTILKMIAPEIVAEVERKGITYIRNLHGGTGFGPSWQDTFETTGKKVMEDYCRASNMNYEWRKDGNLRLKYTTPGILRHRKTHEKVWFNQIDQFHPCHLGEELYESMKLMYESTEDFPMYVTFGDGTAITEELIAEVLKTIDSVTVAPQWQTNELVIVDNELVSHGRNSFTGNRKVLVSMSE